METTTAQHDAWMIYGANGFTGKLIAEQAAATGMKPILAGRSESSIRPLAEKLGLSWRCFDLGSIDHITSCLKDIKLLLHCAGPFSATASNMMQACIASSTDYLDLTGEIEIFQLAESLSEAAANNHCILMPGVGFDILATDCLAAKVSAGINKPQSLELAFCGEGGISPGTAKTMIEMLPGGGKVRRNGHIETIPAAFLRKKIRFYKRDAWCMSIPWGDVQTAYFTTGIPDITVYTATPRPVTLVIRMLNPFMGLLAKPAIQKKLNDSIDKKVPGPDQQTMDKGFTLLWGKASNAQGEHCEYWLNVAEGYRFTQLASLACVRRLLEGPRPAAGYHTPAEAFGADFVCQIEGSTFLDSPF